MSTSTSPWPARIPGLLFAAAIGLAAMLLEPWSRRWGMSALPLAIIIGIVLGNTVFARVEPRTAAGVDYARTMLLRAGIVLFGFRLDFNDIMSVGLAGIVIACLIVASVFFLALWLGRLLKMDADTAMLIGSGASICGAAAVMASEPVIRAQAHKVSVAVATVVVFGTVGMFLYPFLKTPFGLDLHAYGLYAGSTIHEVAQVVVAGEAVDAEASKIAVTEKMIRVILLTPFLLLLSAAMRGRAAGDGRKAKIIVPWFAVLFLLVGAFNSLQLVPPTLHAALLVFGTFLLATAMGALGLRTQIGAIRQAGIKPMLLASLLFVYLIFGGLAINLGVLRLLG
ncbi:YeiH family protein [Luteimonas sp. e5]